MDTNYRIACTGVSGFAVQEFPELLYRHFQNACTLVIRFDGQELSDWVDSCFRILQCAAATYQLATRMLQDDAQSCREDDGRSIGVGS